MFGQGDEVAEEGDARSESECEFRVARASRVLAMRVPGAKSNGASRLRGLSKTYGFESADDFRPTPAQESSFRRDAETSTRDARATRSLLPHVYRAE